ncbi:MAG: AAA family ATPase [Anaerolineales bacterium]|nr:AAA family ATPase [Anaerolineales bacterium]
MITELESARFHAFGPPRFINSSKRKRLHSGKVLALFAYLVCSPYMPHSREKLATLLWSNVTDSKARQSLRQALYSLRHALGELADSCLIVDAQTVIFKPTKRLFVDYLTFDKLAASGKGQEAVALFQGPFLEGLSFDDSPAFEEWLYHERDRLHQRLITLVQVLVDEHLDGGDRDEAIRFGRQLVILDPLNENAHQRLMRAFAANDEIASVKRQFQSCHSILQRELGIEPSEETKKLYEQLVSRQAPAQVSTSIPIPPPARSFPFQGCHEELDQLSHYFTDAISGKMSLALISGEAGSGKTELVLEFCRRTNQTHPFLFLNGRAYEAQIGIPYAIWSEALSALKSPAIHSKLNDLAPIWRQQMAQLVPGLHTGRFEDFSLDSAEAHLRFVQGIVQGLIHLAADTPIVLFFDDLHWSDAASLDLLHYAARQCTSYPVFILGTVRSEAIHVDIILKRSFASDRYPTVSMSPLLREDIESLLTWLNISVSPSAVNRLMEHCQGNRFMFLETMRYLRETNNMDLLLSELEIPIPPRIVELVNMRLAGLGEQARSVLATAAVIGRPVGLRLLRHVSGQSEAAILQDLECLFDHAFLVEQIDDNDIWIGFHHDFVRQVTYENLRRIHRQALHRRTAEALIDQYPSHPQSVSDEIAFHFEQAGDLRCLTYLKQAATQAEQLFALSDAVNLISRALAFQAYYAQDKASLRFDLLLTHENLMSQLGRRSRQAADIEELFTLATAMNDSDCLAQVWVRRAGYLSETGNPQQSKRAAEEALLLFRQSNDKLGEARVLREMGFAYWLSAEYSLALEYGRKALHLHRLIGDIEGEASALHNLAEIHRGLNSPHRAVAFYDESLQKSWAQQDHKRQSLSLYGKAHALRQMGQHQGALGTYQQTLRYAELANDKFLLSRVYHEMATMFSNAGDNEQALSAMQHASAISREAGYAIGLAHSLVGLTYLHLNQDHFEEAREALIEAMEWFRLLEDDDGISYITNYLARVKPGSAVIEEPPARLGWVKTYVTLGEGKIYCEFESPLATAQQE